MPDQKRRHRLVLICFIAILGVAAVRLGADGNGDLRNYHYYSGWAMLHKPVGFDLAPAQMQTYHHPLLDAAYYVVSAALNIHPLVFTFIWAIPQAVAVWFVFLIARRCLPTGTLALTAAVIGALGATSIGVIGTSMSEGVPTLLMFGAVLSILRGDTRARSGGRAGWHYGLAGLLAGTGAVLKLTSTPYLVAFGVAIPALTLLEPAVPRRWCVLAFGAGVMVGLAAVGGPWWLAVTRAFGNPLFPYYNAIFHSPYYPNENLFDSRFLPQTPLEWLSYPLQWATHPSTRVSEQPVQDARVLIEVLAALALLVPTVTRRLRSGLSPAQVSTGFCAVYILVSYGLWLKMFSILRYASGLEMLSGIVIVASVCELLRGSAPRLAAALAALVLLTVTTVVPIWERRPQPGRRLVGTDMPLLPADSTLLVFGPFEKAFLAPFEPTSVRFVGVENNLVMRHRKIGFDDLVEQAVATAPGPVWTLTDADADASVEAAWLERFQLRHIDDCRRVTATIAPPMKLCRVGPPR